MPDQIENIVTLMLQTLFWRHGPRPRPTHADTVVKSSHTLRKMYER